MGSGGFPRRSESPHDVFDGGHAGTGLSIAEGLAEARDLRHGMERIAVVVGDAALMSGLSLEALNDIGHRQTQMLIVVNDNEMSISPTVGAFSRYLSQIKLSRAWHHSKSAYDRAGRTDPGRRRHRPRAEQAIPGLGRRFAQPGQLFEDLGITYIGVVPGHDLHALLETLGRALVLPGPTIVHVRTHKGRGYRPAEADQIGFHGAALPPMTMVPGVDGNDGVALDADRVDDRRRGAAGRRGRGAEEGCRTTPRSLPTSSSRQLASDRRIVGITAGHADRHRAWPSSRPRSRTGCSTSGSPSSTR